MKLESNDIKNKKNIASEFTCDGKGLSPHLKWSDIPQGTKSFALSCEDPDAPAKTWVHWYVYDIPSNINEIPQGGPVPGKETKNDFGRTGYGGPCPPKNSDAHRYFFSIYALKVDKLTGVTKENFNEIVEKNAIESAGLIGLYKRK